MSAAVKARLRGAGPAAAQVLADLTPDDDLDAILDTLIL